MRGLLVLADIIVRGIQSGIPIQFGADRPTGKPNYVQHRGVRAEVSSMRIFLDDDFLPGFIPGAVVHVIMVFSRINFWAFNCGTVCDTITYYDIPVSLFYFFFSDAGIILSSLLLGSILWGFYGYIALKLLRRIFQNFGIG